MVVLLSLWTLLVCSCASAVAGVNGSVVMNGLFGLVGFDGATIFELPGAEQCNGVRYFDGYSYCSSQHKGGQLLRAKGVEFDNMTTVVNASPLPNAHLVVLSARFAFVSDVMDSIWRVTLSTGYTRKLISGVPNTRGMFLVDDDTLLSAGDHIARSTGIQGNQPAVDTLISFGNSSRFAYDVLQLNDRIYWTENCGIWSCDLSGGDVQTWKSFKCPSDASIWSGPYFLVANDGFLYWTRGIRYDTQGNYFERAPVDNPDQDEALFVSFKREWFYDLFQLPPDVVW